MKTISFLLLALLSFFVMTGCSSKNGNSRPTMLFNLDYDDMLSIKDELKNGDAEINNAYLQIITKADSLLPLAPYKVTDGDMPPTGNQNDFFSIGKYAFPNSDTPDGMPYIRKDGLINPEAFGDRYDLERYQQTTERVNTLSLAWFYSGDEKYAAKAAELLRVWFINPETRMNPNFECASALPGVYNGMPIGIIFGARLVDFLDHVQLLTLSRSWTVADNDGLKKWFEEYTNWLQTSSFGMEESRANNNHGSWYAAQIAAAAVYNNNTELAKQMIDLGKKQLADQVAMNKEEYPDGSLPREINRNQSFLYSLFGLEGFCALAGCGNAINYDLWHFETENGRGMKAAFEFLTPYLLEEKTWPYQSLRAPKDLMPKALHMSRQAAKMFKTDDLIKVQEHVQQYALNDPYQFLESKNFK